MENKARKKSLGGGSQVEGFSLSRYLTSNNYTLLTT